MRLSGKSCMLGQGYLWPRVESVTERRGDGSGSAGYGGIDPGSTRAPSINLDTGLRNGSPRQERLFETSRLRRATYEDAGPRKLQMTSRADGCALGIGGAGSRFEIHEGRFAERALIVSPTNECFVCAGESVRQGIFQSWKPDNPRIRKSCRVRLLGQQAM